MQNVNPKLIEYVSKLEQVKSIVERIPPEYVCPNIVLCPRGIPSNYTEYQRVIVAYLNSFKVDVPTEMLGMFTSDLIVLQDMPVNDINKDITAEAIQAKGGSALTRDTTQWLIGPTDVTHNPDNILDMRYELTMCSNCGRYTETDGFSFSPINTHSLDAYVSRAYGDVILLGEIPYAAYACLCKDDVSSVTMFCSPEMAYFVNDIMIPAMSKKHVHIKCIPTNNPPMAYMYAAVATKANYCLVAPYTAELMYGDWCYFNIVKYLHPNVNMDLIGYSEVISPFACEVITSATNHINAGDSYSKFGGLVAAEANVQSTTDIEKLFNVQHFTNLIATTAKKHGLELITHI